MLTTRRASCACRARNAASSAATAALRSRVSKRTWRYGDESANRDESVFENPDVYDVERERNQHVAFGWGTHFCLGASVARLEIRLMFEELMKRIPEMRLEPGAEPRFQPNCFTRTPDAVRVEFDPAPPIGSRS